MGGFGSGLFGGRPLSEDGVRLDLTPLIASGYFQTGKQTHGLLRWANERSLVALALYEADLSQVTSGSLLLQTPVIVRHEVGWYSEKLKLETTRPTYGGVRWWFICPLSGRRSRVLYRPDGVLRFASRQAHGLAYRSQRQTDSARLIEKSRTIRQKLGIDEVDLLSLPRWSKPQGMHWRTYYQSLVKMEELRQALWRAAPL
jgi:hypothetical protein